MNTKKWQIEFRKLWSRINQDNKHLTTQKIEDLIARIESYARKDECSRIVKEVEKMIEVIMRT